MDIGVYEMLLHLSELTGCTLDECLAYVSLGLMVHFVGLGFSVGLFIKVGLFFVDVLEKLFRVILRRFRHNEKEEP